MLLLHSKRKRIRGKSFRAPPAPELLSLCAGSEERQKQKLSSAYGSRVTFSLRGQRESNPRERPPRLALAGHPVRQVREPGPGFSSGLLPARKGVAIPGNARCAACRPRLTAAQGTPGRAAGHRGPHSVMKLKSHSHSKASLCCGFARAFDLAPLKSARRMRAALPGSPLKRRTGGGKARRVAGMNAGQFVVSTGNGMDAGVEATQERLPDVLSTNPTTRPRTLRAGCPQGA